MLLQLAHTKLDIFNATQDLAVECYHVTKAFPNDEKFALVQQLRRAAVSVHLNIAEGCSRKSEVERRRYLEISRGFLIEVDAAIGIAYRLSYCDTKDINKLGELIISCFKQLSVMINHHSN